MHIRIRRSWTAKGRAAGRGADRRQVRAPLPAALLLLAVPALLLLAVTLVERFDIEPLSDFSAK